MHFSKNFQLLERINGMIIRKTIGTPKQIADRLSISPRKFHRMINELRDFGATIIYNRSRHFYYYENEEEAKKLLPFKG